MENLKQNLALLESLGFTLPTPAYIFGTVLFGFIGMYAWYRGKKKKLPVFKWIGVALMVYPLFVPETWMMYAAGCALCIGLYMYRE
jgi:uncharacterized membrane protein YdcZ (DUF606 family)